tara:strand:- start:1697 stop:2062 length:366 start_codon:yes stop_codon:yes gene_type:complete
MKDQTFFISEELSGRISEEDLLDGKSLGGVISAEILTEKTLLAPASLSAIVQEKDGGAITVLCDSSVAADILSQKVKSIRIKTGDKDLASYSISECTTKSIEIKSPGLYEAELIFTISQPN